MATITFDQFLPGFTIDSGNGMLINVPVNRSPDAGEAAQMRMLLDAIKSNIQFMAKFRKDIAITNHSNGDISLNVQTYSSMKGTTIIKSSVAAKGTEMWNQLVEALKNYLYYLEPVPITCLPECYLYFDRQQEVIIDVYDVVNGNVAIAFNIVMPENDWKNIISHMDTYCNVARIVDEGDFTYMSYKIPRKYVDCIHAELINMNVMRKNVITAEVQFPTTGSWPKLIVMENKKQVLSIHTPPIVFKAICEQIDKTPPSSPTQANCREETFIVSNADDGYMNISAKNTSNSFSIRHQWKSAVRSALDTYFRDRDL